MLYTTIMLPNGIPWREKKDLDISSFALPQVILHLLIDHNNLSFHTKKGAAIIPSMFMSRSVGLVVWFSLRVREVLGSTPGQALSWQTCEVKDETYLLFQQTWKKKI